MADTTVRRFAARLHNLRLEKSMTQEALAASARLHPSYISGLERGRQIPSLSTLEQLARGLNVDMAVLVDFPDSKAPKDRVREELELIQRRLRSQDLNTVRKARKIIELLTS